MIPRAKPIIDKEEKKAVLDVLDSGMLAQGKKVKELEEMFANLCGVDYAVTERISKQVLSLPVYSSLAKEDVEKIIEVFRNLK